MTQESSFVCIQTLDSPPSSRRVSRSEDQWGQTQKVEGSEPRRSNRQDQGFLHKRTVSCLDVRHRRWSHDVRGKPGRSFGILLGGRITPTDRDSSSPCTPDDSGLSSAVSPYVHPESVGCTRPRRTVGEKANTGLYLDLSLRLGFSRTNRP